MNMLPLDARVLTLENRVNKIETESTVSDVHRKNVERRLDAIEDTLKWLSRLILGALIMALIAFVVKGGLGGA